MSIPLESLVAQLAKRVEALERAASRTDPPRHLNAQRKAEGARLRKAIERIIAAQPAFTAKHVLRALPLAELERTEPPSVRTIQWHIKAVRAMTQ